MQRIPYVPADTSEPAALVNAIRGRRGGELYNLDRILLHSPAFAQAWNAFMGEVRGGLSVTPKLRELAICVVAVENRADYEYAHHVPELRAAGATEVQLAALKTLSDAAADVSMFDQTERAVIAFTRALTRHAAVDDATFNALAAALTSHRQLVELIGVIGAYNMVSRFLLGCGIELE